MNSTHHYEQLIEIFNSCFADEFNTRLIKGDDEPIYLPADAEVPYNRIVFAHGFYASAIHEISHWCIAGKARRELVEALVERFRPRELFRRKFRRVIIIL